MLPSKPITRASVRGCYGVEQRRGRRSPLLLCVVCLAILPTGQVNAAPSIFDDNWTPPESAKQAKTVVHEKQASSTVAGAPATRLSPATTQAHAARQRHSLPGKTEQLHARQLMREAFSKELGDHSAEARRSLAARLLDEASNAADKPVDEYVLLCGAYQAAREVGDLELCVKAADEMSERFEVDGLALKLSALPGAPAGTDPARAHAAVKAGFAVIDEAVAEENFAGARVAASAVESAAGRAGNRSILAYVKERLADERVLITESARVQKDLATLRTHPDDAAANYAVGRFLCFVKGNWETGLPRLAKCSDATLRNAAVAELAVPEGAARLKLADDWWTIAQRQAGVPQYRIERHAAEHYQAVVETLTGLEKVRVQRRLADALPLALSVGERYRWGRDMPPAKMIPLSQGICVLSGIGGFFGREEEIGIGVVDASAWSLAGRTKANCHAYAHALLSPSPGAFKLPVEYTWKSGDAPVRMIRTDEGVCVLAGIAGPLRGEADNVGVHPDEDGYWYLGGRAGPGLTVRALSLQAAKPGTYRAFYTEHEWRPVSGAVRLLGKDEGFCFISGVCGMFAGDGEDVYVTLGENGAWYLDGASKQASVAVRAISVHTLPARP